MHAQLLIVNITATLNVTGFHNSREDIRRPEFNLWSYHMRYLRKNIYYIKLLRPQKLLRKVTVYKSPNLAKTPNLILKNHVYY